MTGDASAMDDSIWAAAERGDATAVRRWLTEDAGLATRPDAAKGWDALTYLCFSPQLRQPGPPDAAFVDAARALLGAGASANTGFVLDGEFECVLYGAAGIAHHAALTRLLLERGADPNDGEVTYHSPETYDNAALRVLLESSSLTPDSLAAMLLRKCDWHDLGGVDLLLGRGADPNRTTQWGYTALHQAIRRDNGPEILERLCDHGADPAVVAHGLSAAARAAWEGRGDVLRLWRDRGVAIDLQGAARLLAACALDEADGVRTLAGDDTAVQAVLAQAGFVLGEFAGIGNTRGVGHLLGLGVDVGTPIVTSDAYWGLAADSSALHVAAWRAEHATVRFLLDRGAAVDAVDGAGRTPLILAVKACVDSYWMRRRAPDSVAALLAAGASRHGVALPTGYEAIDALLAAAS